MCMAAAAFGARGGALGALFDRAKSNKKKSPTELADGTAEIPAGPAPIGGAPRPITAKTPGISGTGLQIGR